MDVADRKRRERVQVSALVGDVRDVLAHGVGDRVVGDTVGGVELAGPDHRESWYAGQPLSQFLFGCLEQRLDPIVGTTRRGTEQQDRFGVRVRAMRAHRTLEVPRCRIEIRSHELR